MEDIVVLGINFIIAYINNSISHLLSYIKFIITIANIFITNYIDNSIFYLLKYIAFILTMHVILFSIKNVGYFKIPPLVLYKNANIKKIKVALNFIVITIVLWIIFISNHNKLIAALYLITYIISFLYLTYLLYIFFKLNYKYIVETEEISLNIKTGYDLYTITSLTDVNVSFSEAKEIFNNMLEGLSQVEVQKFNEIVKKGISRYYSNKKVEYLFLEYILECNTILIEDKNQILLEKFNRDRYELLSEYTIRRIKKNIYNQFNDKDFLIDLFLEGVASDRENTEIDNRDLKFLSDFMDSYIVDIKNKLKDDVLISKYFSQFLLYKKNHINKDLYYKKFIDILFTDDELRLDELLEIFNFILKYCTDCLTFKISENMITTNNMLEDKTIKVFSGKTYSIWIALEQKLTFENIKNKIDEKIKKYEEIKKSDKKELIARNYLELRDMSGRYKSSGIEYSILEVNIVNEYSEKFIRTLDEENKKFITYFEDNNYTTNILNNIDKYNNLYDPYAIIGQKNINGRTYRCLLLEEHKLGEEVIKVQEEALDNVILAYKDYIDSLKENIKEEEEITSILNCGKAEISEKNTRATSLINNLCKYLFSGKKLSDNLNLFSVSDDSLMKKFSEKLLKYSYVVDRRTLNSALVIHYICSQKKPNLLNSVLFFNNKKFYYLTEFSLVLKCINEPETLMAESYIKMKNHEIISENKKSINYIVYCSTMGIVGDGYFDWEYDELETKYIKRGNIDGFSSVQTVDLDKLFRSQKFLDFLKEYYVITGELLIDFKCFEFNDEEISLHKDSFKEISNLNKKLINTD